MRIPIPLHFAFDPNRPYPSDGTVLIPKVLQGAPYAQTMKVRDPDGVYRDFSVYDEMRMQAKLSQSRAALFTLTKTAGELQGTGDSFSITFGAAKTEALELPITNPLKVNEVPFVYDLELIIAGQVVEILAAGTGLIVVNTTRNA